MKITFDPDFDHGAWPGPVGERSAVAGEEWIGWLGLLGRLEVMMGVGGPVPSAAERAAALIPRLSSTEGFWSSSAAVDPLGTARRLLEWRDDLFLRGWSGDVPPDSGRRRSMQREAAPLQLDLLGSPSERAGDSDTASEIGPGRLRALAEICRDALPGIPDRLLAIGSALERRSAHIEELAHFADLAELPSLWRTVLRRLCERGTAFRRLDLHPVPSTGGDLHAARSGAFAPAGDGSLQLLRPYGPLAAAEETAAWLAALGSLDGVVILGADAVLDLALRRHGLPTTGATLPARENLLLQILPLVLDLAWQPADPQRALELLTLSMGPVPGSIARGLSKALHEWPAVDSDLWRQKLAEGLAIVPEDRRPRVASRLETIFSTPLDRSKPYPAAEVERRITAMETWARGRQAKDSSATDADSWQAPLEQLGSLRRLVELSGLSELTSAQLQWFAEAATAAAPSSPSMPASAGLATVNSPGSITGPARAIVWWNFSLGTAAPLRRVPLSRAEQDMLAAAGVELPDPGAEAVRLARRWRRPLEQTQQTLILVTPRRRANGEEDFPHPLWDEIAAGLDEVALRRIELSTPIFAVSPPRHLGVLRPAARPRREWRVPAGAIEPAATESPTSLSTFLGCSFKWSLEKVARLRPGETGRLPKAEQLAGSLAHEILSRVLTGSPSSPDAAALAARELFEREGPRLAAPFFLPGADATRAEAGLLIELSARVLCGILAEGGMRVEMAEAELTSAAGAWKDRLRGRVDLVVSPPRAVFDLKWGSASHHRSALENGTSLQLAAYSLMLRPTTSAAWAPVAYFILKTQQLLSTSDALPGSERIAGPDMEATWTAVQEGYDSGWAALRAGRLSAPGNPNDANEVLPDQDDIDIDGRLVLKPPCRFCELGALCGLALSREMAR